MSNEGSTATEKATELARIVESALNAEQNRPSLDTWLKVIDCLATIEPPETSISIGFFTIDAGGRGGGYSVKPGNITFNMRRLVTALSAGVLTAVAAFNTPWTAVFGAILLWDRMYAGATIEVSEHEAAVLWTMWQLKDDESTVAHDGLLAHVNNERRKYRRSELSKEQLDDALAKLERIRTIERFSKFKSRWWLREWVRVPYE